MSCNNFDTSEMIIESGPEDIQTERSRLIKSHVRDAAAGQILYVHTILPTEFGIKIFELDYLDKHAMRSPAIEPSAFAVNQQRVGRQKSETSIFEVYRRKSPKTSDVRLTSE